jgi:hypothetical protein
VKWLITRDAMKIFICPGMHPVALTQCFVEAIDAELKQPPDWTIFPGDRLPVYSPHHVLSYLPSDPTLMIGFSAGVVGAIAAAKLHQRHGHSILGLIAIDGWGVPLAADFPIYRVSHDYFTHQTSALLGAGLDSFYADPGVDHLTLWRSPQQVSGYHLSTPISTATFTAARFMAHLINTVNGR